MPTRSRSRFVGISSRCCAGHRHGRTTRRADRILLANLANLAKLLPRQRWPVFLVTPATLLRWYRELVARRWTYPHAGRGVRGLDGQVVELVLRLARENPRRVT